MGNGIDDGEDYSISAGKIKQAGFIYPCYYQPFTARKNRGDWTFRRTPYGGTSDLPSRKGWPSHKGRSNPSVVNHLWTGLM
jgi:hypothetical protein